MSSAVVLSVVATSSVWVYFDATKNKIGKISYAKGMFNISAGAWAIATLLLWIVAFPAYLIKRSSLKAGATASAVTATCRDRKIVNLRPTTNVLIRNSSAIFIFATVQAVSANEKEVPVELQQAFIQVSQKFIDSVQMPDVEKLPKFKSLQVGSPFEIHSETVDIRVDDVGWAKDGQRYSCKLSKYAPFADCDITNQHPEEAALKSAFGVPVKTQFTVMLNKPPSAEEMNGKVALSGRIVAIRIESKNPTKSFSGDAKQYFTSLLGSLPIHRLLVKNPESVYTKKCHKIIGEVGNKAISTITSSDIVKVKACEAEVLNIDPKRLFGMNQAKYDWGGDSQPYYVSILSEEVAQRVSESASGIIPTRVEIRMGANISAAFETWRSEVNRVGKEWDESQANKAKKDF